MRWLALSVREFNAFFLTPTGYIVTALFLFLSGIAFIGGFDAGKVASMRSVFGVGIFLLVVIGPAISMRSLAEEYRLGTIEALLTAPISAGEVILGKFLGSMAFLVAMLLPTLIYVVLLESFGRPDYGELASGYLGMLLAGAAFISGGILASTLTASQVVAFLVSLFFWLILVTASKALPLALENWLPGVFSDRTYAFLLAWDPDARLKDFAIGLIDTGNVIYFLAYVVVFLAISIRSLEARRWL